MITVVVPVHNEVANIEPLLDKIATATQTVPITEVIYVDDCSRDGTPAVLEKACAAYPFLRVICHRGRCGQSAALWTGISHAQNGIIVTLDGDGQNDPVDIAKIYDQYCVAGAGRVMVAGQRKKRHDNVVRRVSSRIANRVRSSLLKDGVRDAGCSLKLFRRDDFLMLPRMNHLHRFLHVLMQREGVTVVLCDVVHHPRRHGVSKYGVWNRLWVGIVDLFGVRWLQRRAFDPVDIAEVTKGKPNECVSGAA